MPRTTFYRHKNVQVTTEPNIGLDTAARQAVVEMLNLVLADESILALKTRQMDGQADGVEVPGLRSLYDSQSQQISTISNEIIERIQILGGTPLSRAEALTDAARLEGDPSVSPGMINLLADHEAFIRFLREDAQKCSEMYEDQGTYALLISVMRSHEKMAWFLRSNINPDQFDDEK